MTTLALFLLTACEDVNNTQANIAEDSTFCAIDTIKNGAVITTAEQIYVAGWAFDELSDSTPEHVHVKFTSTNEQASKTFDAQRGAKRPDVVKAFNKPGVEMSGFDLMVPANTLATGKYKIVILQDTPKYNLSCDKGLDIEIIEQATPVQPPIVSSTTANEIAAPVVLPTATTKKSSAHQKKVDHSKE